MHFFLSPHGIEVLSWEEVERELSSLLTKISLLTIGIKGKAHFQEATIA